MLPLEGIRVLDWTIWQQGPVASAFLADLGAEVIKIEPKETGDPGRGLKRLRGIPVELPGGRNFYFEYNNRNKKGIAIDLRKEAGKEIIYRLTRKSDVFVQNFRQGVAERLGLDYATLSQYNPKLIYANASGYGPRGPESREPAFDYLGLARSGIMTAIGEPDMPPLGMIGGIADQMGAIMLAYAILAALIVRERWGISQEIDVSHLGSMIALQGLHVAAVCLLGKQIPRQPRERASNPLWNHYRCGDGKWLALAHLQSDRYWDAFCQAIEREDLKEDPRFADALSRERNAGELVSILDQVFATKTAKEWMDLLKQKGDFICCPINNVADLLNDPQVMANQYIIDFDHPVLGKTKMVGFPIQFSKTPLSMRLPAPELGQHTEEVLLNIADYTWEEIEELKKQEVI